MKNSVIKTTIFTLLFLWTIKGLAQQDPIFTQYMYNLSVINPAYATSNEGVINLGGLYRTQWTGIEGAPQTATFFAHTPINDRVEIGISFVHDEIGDVLSQTGVFADFAYKLRVSEFGRLALGLKAGATFFSTDFNGFQLGSGDITTDPAFAANANETFPNVGIGAFYYGDNYYVGLSAPNLLNNTHLEEENGVSRFGEEAVHYYLTGGYVFDINADFKVKPSAMIRAVGGAPLSVDINANVLMYQRFEAGVSYRIGDAVAGLVNFEVKPGLRIGYAYDYTLSNLGDYSSGSHEIMVLFDLDFFGFMPGYLKSPRFF
ncbi:PorP/SprF family type IX secretion system membrane protein [Croceiramulus getboli]|nr:type IX secretion system membrane protein PorP/SprF [Flavobacteriaceae bacterium YJPT1-3]